MRSAQIVWMTSALAVLPALAHAAPFTNGTFVDPPCDGYFCTYQAGSTAIGSWVVSQGNIDQYSPGAWQSPPPGGDSIDLEGCCDGAALAGGMAQSFDTIPGDSYEVTFYMSGNPDGGASLKIMGVTAGSYSGRFKYDTATNGTTHADMHYKRHAFSFTATSTTTTLNFFSKTKTNFGYGPVIGGVAVSPPVFSGFSTLYSFTGAADGSTPNGGLAPNGAGQLYGSTYGGGANGAGTIFSFDPAGNQLTTLYQFTGQADGAEPLAKLTIGADGSVYGSTQYGGTANSGTVFKLLPASGQLTTLYAFQGLADGAEPGGGLLIDSSGNLDGFAHAGGAYNFGDIFQVNPTSLTEKTLHSFRGGGDGSAPSLIAFNSLGVIYGPTSKGGGASDAGTLFSLNEATGKKRTLYKFSGGADGSGPTGAFAFDAAGNFYGTTISGGAAGAGTIFEYSPATSKLMTLYSFTGNADGSGPRGGMIFDSTGNLYGTTVKTDGDTNSGTLFRFTPASGQLVTLHSFSDGADGATPSPYLAIAPSGIVYGTTTVGGNGGFGTIFSFTP